MKKNIYELIALFFALISIVFFSNNLELFGVLSLILYVVFLYLSFEEAKK